MSTPDPSAGPDLEDSVKPSMAAIAGGVIVGALLGMGALGGLASLAHLDGALFIFVGALFGGGVGLSLTAILAQARVNSSI
jgi:hypothetical protein